MVEADTPVGEVMALLESRSLAAAFGVGASVYAKRQDGTTVPMKVDAKQSIANLESKITQLEVRGPHATHVHGMHARWGGGMYQFEVAMGAKL
jgi:hypothetical protein